MINVAVSGFAGRMGSAVVDAVTAAGDLRNRPAWLFEGVRSV